MRLSTLLLCTLFSSQAFGDEAKSIWRFTNSSQEISQQKIVEFWTTNNSNDDGLYSHEFKLRYYNPLEINRWRGTLRLDTSVISTSPNLFIASNTGQYSAGNTMITVWGQDNGFLKKIKRDGWWKVNASIWKQWAMGNRSATWVDI